jgi:hypothetical protein
MTYATKMVIIERKLLKKNDNHPKKIYLKSTSSQI